MAIAVGTSGLSLTTKNRPIPNIVITALAAPGPVAIDTDGAGEGGGIPVELCVTSNHKSYLGYSYLPTVAAGEQAALANGAIVEGFTGVTPGALIYVDTDGSLTETAPDWETGVKEQRGIGIGVRSTAIYFFP